MNYREWLDFSIHPFLSQSPELKQSIKWHLSIGLKSHLSNVSGLNSFVQDSPWKFDDVRWTKFEQTNLCEISDCPKVNFSFLRGYLQMKSIPMITLSIWANERNPAILNKQMETRDTLEVDWIEEVIHLIKDNFLWYLIMNLFSIELMQRKVFKCSKETCHNVPLGRLSWQKLWKVSRFCMHTHTSALVLIKRTTQTLWLLTKRHTSFNPFTNDAIAELVGLFSFSSCSKHLSKTKPNLIRFQQFNCKVLFPLLNGKSSINFVLCDFMDAFR